MKYNNFIISLISLLCAVGHGQTVVQNAVLQSWACVPSSPLVGWWKLNDGSGSSAADSSGNGYTMSLYNSPSWVSSSLVFGHALSFTASSSQYGECAGDVASQVAGSATATLCYWFKTSVNQGHTVGFSTTGQERFFTLAYSDSALYLTVEGGSYGGVRIPDVADGNWHHLAMVFNGAGTGWGRITIYLDGVVQSVTNDPYQPPATLASVAQLGHFYVGWDVYDGAYATGAINDIRLYNIALTSAQVAHVYNGGGGNASQ
jgi:hypothetical protein